MIRTYQQTPGVYSEESRDYQLFGHLFDLAFNDSKASIDSMENNVVNRFIDKRLLPLVAMTLGYNIKHNYDDDNLYFLCTSFKYILRHKGTKKALEEGIRLLLRAQGLSDDCQIIITNTSGNEFHQYTIDIYVSDRLKDLVLFKDLLEYILPTGYVYSIHKGFSTKNKIKTEISGVDSVKAKGLKSSETMINNDLTSGGNVIGQIGVNHEIVIIGNSEVNN